MGQQQLSETFYKLKHAEGKIPAPDLTGVSSVLEKELGKIREEINQRPKPINRNYRLLLFPESDTERYYKLVFGRLIPWGFAFVLLCYLLSMVNHGIEAWRQHDRNEQNDQAAQAWVYLYGHSGKQVKKAMGNAWEKSRKQ